MLILIYFSCSSCCVDAGEPAYDRVTIYQNAQPIPDGLIYWEKDINPTQGFGGPYGDICQKNTCNINQFLYPVIIYKLSEAQVETYLKGDKQTSWHQISSLENRFRSESIISKILDPRQINDYTAMSKITASRPAGTGVIFDYDLESEKVSNLVEGMAPYDFIKDPLQPSSPLYGCILLCLPFIITVSLIVGFRKKKS